MYILILKIIAAVICTEAMTELAVKSELFLPLRKFLFESKLGIFRFIHKIFDCGYCFSVWAAMLSIVLIYNINIFTIHLMAVLIIHRLSNLLHSLGDVVRKHAEY
jgi:hypothetical protein